MQATTLRLSTVAASTQLCSAKTKACSSLAPVSRHAAFSTVSFLGKASALSAVRSSSAAKLSRSQVQTMALFGSATAGKTFYDFQLKDIDGKTLKTDAYKNKVVLVVNVASQCGFTPQYKGLAELYNKYSSKGLVVLGAPCNQFGAQEPGSNSDIKSFAQKMGAKFPLTTKLDVNGGSADPVFDFLKTKAGGLLTNDIKWNFTKFLVDKSGNVVKRYASTTTPAEIEKDIAALL